MKETFYLVRHGQKAGGINPPLSELGVKQAQAVAEFLTLFPIQAIVVSPLLRTLQTAEFIRNELKLELKTDDLLKERVSWGDAPNQTGEEFMTMWRRAYVDRSWQPPAGDSSLKSAERFQTALGKYRSNGTEHTVFVTHAGIITDFLLSTFGTTFLNTIRPDFTQKSDKCIHEASVTIIEYPDHERQPTLLKLGTIDHLPADLRIPK